MRYGSCYSETFFTFYAQVIMLKLLPEHLCLGQSTTILWMPFMWKYHCKAMNSLLEIGAQDFHFKRKKLFQFPQGPNARGRKGLGQASAHITSFSSWSCEEVHRQTIFKVGEIAAQMVKINQGLLRKWWRTWSRSLWFPSPTLCCLAWRGTGVAHKQKVTLSKPPSSLALRMISLLPAPHQHFSYGISLGRPW